MQASVHTFEQDGSGTVLLDSGVIHPFAAEVFDTSDLRLLRVGQRLSIELGQNGRTVSPETSDTQSGAVVIRLWIVGIGDDEAIV